MDEILDVYGNALISLFGISASMTLMVYMFGRYSSLIGTILGSIFMS